MKCENLILIGFMGCGKTTVGALLAKRLGWTFIDTDRYIEQEQGKTVEAIFAEEGEQTFRGLERDCIARLSRRRHQVIATGGGAVKDADNVRALRETGCILYLRLPASALYERVANDDTRPLLKPYAGEEKRRRIEALLAERGALYEAACNQIIDGEGMNPEETVSLIRKRLGLSF